MFSYIKGNLENKNINFIVLDVNGMGFRIYMSQKSIDNLPEINNEVKIFTYMQVREDDISLFGFNTQEELRMFELLIGVSGVGAKSAITMLSNIEASTFAIAIISNDLDKLTKIPGIGKKTAQRIVLELKDKMKKESIETKINAKEIENEVQVNSKKEEVISALIVLGYTRVQINNVIEKIQIDQLSIEDIIKQALINLS